MCAQLGVQEEPKLCWYGNELGPVFPKLLAEQKGAEEGEKYCMGNKKNVYREKLQELQLISLAFVRNPHCAGECCNVKNPENPILAQNPSCKLMTKTETEQFQLRCEERF